MLRLALVVGASEVMAAWLAERLECCGVQVVVANNAEAALEAVRTRRPDLLLLDLVLPLSGVEEMLDETVQAGVPVLLVSKPRGEVTNFRPEIPQLPLPQDPQELEAVLWGLANGHLGHGFGSGAHPLTEGVLRGVVGRAATLLSSMRSQLRRERGA